MNQDTFRKLISGQSSDWNIVALRLLLAIAEKLYSVVIAVRNFSYSRGWLKTHRVDATVISVGNITVGGTGKTPLVIWLYNLLQTKGLNCAILTRGYKTKRDKFSDEPLILSQSCPKAEVMVNPDRLASAAKAIDKSGATVLIMDDGFQHRRLARDLDIVTIDATAPFGIRRQDREQLGRQTRYKMLPAGLLREPLKELKRADAVVITRCDLLAEYKLGQLEKQLQSFNPDMIITRSAHAPVCAKSLGGDEISLEQLRDKNIFVFCGIGNPDAFLATVGKLTPNIAGFKVYNDHHRYLDRDIDEIYEQARQLKAELILSTQKDWTKTALLTSAKKDIPFAYLAIELKFLAGQDKLKRLIEEALAGKIGSNQ